MTRLQTSAIVVAAFAVWATGAYPRWQLSYAVRSETSASIVSTAVARDWLLTEKTLPGSSGLFPELRAGAGYSVDFGRLAVEWVIIAALCRAVVAAVERKTEWTKN